MVSLAVLHSCRDRATPHCCVRHMACAPQAPEYAVQMGLSVILCVGRKWIFGPLQLLVTAWNVRTVMRNEARTDVTEIFRQLPRVKKVKLFKLFGCLLCFVYCIFRWASRIVVDAWLPLRACA